LILVAGFGVWAAKSSAAGSSRLTLPSTVGEIVDCEADRASEKEVFFPDLGSFSMTSLGDAPRIVARVGRAFVSSAGLKTVPLQIISNGGHSFAEGLGETRFWLDASRPVQSAIWEKSPGTEFPAIQEMRFHFLYTAEAFPGRVFRSMNPSIMRSENVLAFPPPPGTVYTLVKPIDLEDIAHPGVVVGRVLKNRVVIPQAEK
ncbi:MAG TPA: hypothetical protein PK413_15580, partial [Thermoanaerobaculia bacterium]|nr:hypothetical protein [Thermoanaerobaculia bacterium]